MPVGELLARISSRELTEWMAYWRLEPWGEPRADLRAAIIAATVANTARDPRRKPRPFKPADFLPRFERRRQSWQEQLRYIEWLNAALGGRDLRPGRDDPHQR